MLKKYKGDQLTRALKGYALHRSGRADEALQLMRELTEEGPRSERVAMTMAYTLKAAGDVAGITRVRGAARPGCGRVAAVVWGLAVRPKRAPPARSRSSAAPGFMRGCSTV